MGIKSIYTDTTGQVQVNPRRVKIISYDNLAAVITAGYLNKLAVSTFNIYPTDVIDMIYDYVDATNTGTYGEFLPVFSNGIITLTAASGVTLPTVANNVAIFSNTSGGLSDSGIPISNVVLDVKVGGQTISSATASATPGTIRALRGLMAGTNATMTSGNLVGVRGEVDYVGASGGFLYGVQGKLIPTGTLSGSSWNAGVFGQLDISAATVNAGQMAPIWADYGATSGTLTNVTGLRMFAGTNTTAAVLNSMDYRYGKASALFELAGDAGSYITAGAATPSGDLKKIAITIDGVVHYILAAAVWS